MAARKLPTEQADKKKKGIVGDIVAHAEKWNKKYMDRMPKDFKDMHKKEKGK